MKLLLDTHAILWSIDRPDLLSGTARAAILDKANELTVSVASVWEMRLKVQSGKLEFPVARDYMETHLRKLGVSRFLPVEMHHVRQVGDLPPLHKDPFDRILVAQALAEGLVILSKDAVLREYPVTVLW